ncbi:MAG: bile acid:sodium symporter family protein [Acidipropionibacterium sp.]|nr:bile acid:sodium symporter family protein [Acidipropionibacterium sp.]
MSNANSRAAASARITVIVFPLIILAGGACGIAWSGPLHAVSAAVPYLLGGVMFLMGITLSSADFARIAHRPLPVLAGVAAHYTIMPATALAVCHLLRLPPQIAIGVILVGCAPSGTASNVVTFLAKGDVAFGVSVTTASTLASPVLTPLLTWLLAGRYLSVPFVSMLLDIVRTVLVPVCAGVLVHAVARPVVAKLRPVLPWLAAALIAFLVAVVMAGAHDVLLTAGLSVVLAVILHNGAGLALGHLAGKAMRLPTAQQRALSFEVAMQNSGLAATLAGAYFTPAAALAPAIFSVWHNLSGAVLAGIYAGRRPRDREHSNDQHSNEMKESWAQV